MSDELTGPEHYEEGGAEIEGDMRSRGVITLLSDFGRDDHYVAVMKGVILEINSDVHIVDVTHSVSPYDIMGGAVLLGAAYRFFPKGTIHVAVVDPGVGGERQALLAATENYFFVGPDNGLLSYVFEDPAFLWVRELQTVEFFLQKVSSTFHGRDVFAPVAGYLSTGESPDKFGPLLLEPVTLDSVRGRVEQSGTIFGEVIFVDSFGNLITNIDTSVFWEGETKSEEDGGRNFPVIEIGGASIRGIGEFYQEATPGKLGAHFNSWPLLEIFLPQGSASEKLGLEKGAPVKIKFESES